VSGRSQRLVLLEEDVFLERTFRDVRLEVLEAIGLLFPRKALVKASVELGVAREDSSHAPTDSSLSTSISIGCIAARMHALDLGEGAEAVVVHLGNLGDTVNLYRQTPLAPQTLSVIGGHLIIRLIGEHLESVCVEAGAVVVNCWRRQNIWLFRHHFRQVVSALPTHPKRTLGEVLESPEHARYFVPLGHHDRVADEVQNFV